MMESVEDIPRDAILEGIPWDWTTHPQYLDSVQRLSPALNVVGLVGHCAVRYQVMGDRSLSEEEPTPDELARMREIVAESIAGGAVGYSTSRILVHRVPDGRAVPGTYATNDEHLGAGRRHERRRGWRLPGRARLRDPGRQRVPTAAGHGRAGRRRALRRRPGQRRVGRARAWSTSGTAS